MNVVALFITCHDSIQMLKFAIEKIAIVITLFEWSSSMVKPVNSIAIACPDAMKSVIQHQWQQHRSEKRISSRSINFKISPLRPLGNCKLPFILPHHWIQLKVLFLHFRRDIAIIQVFYEDSFFRSFVKDELIGFTEFLCNFIRCWYIRCLHSKSLNQLCFS